MKRFLTKDFYTFVCAFLVIIIAAFLVILFAAKDVPAPVDNVAQPQ